MKIFNSITKEKEDFTPLEKGHIKMYVCGPTVYDYLHVGNARPLVVFDTVRRFLENQGYIVNYVQNFTDVDDKIIQRALAENTTMDAISIRYINEARTDMNGLNILAPTFSPKVTEEMESIIQMIQTLVTMNHAYETEGSVYFDTATFPKYGILKKVNQEQSQSRLEEDNHKRNPDDFVLWKAKKKDEPFFESPWGQGRPGWHIECSAMAKKYLGSTIDIHGGGIDLLFPHHENEIAQSCCANKAPFANFFMHNGFINIESKKMSKSEGNFFTIRDVANNVGYNTLRFYILSHHYRSTIDFSRELLESAKMGLARITQCLKNLQFIVENKQENSGETLTDVLASTKDTKKFRHDFEQALKDDFNTALAISIIFDYVKFANLHVTEQSPLHLAEEIRREITDMCQILGLKFEESKEINEEIEDLIKQREEARKAKDYALADKIRQQITQMGVVLEDTKSGIRWRYIE
ncbi:MAG: cysteine--tRNA ligase [Defluviitaleaceae bacterium]|nr:cysteine--tRNA ligase [Defluviitaleaceae bacterium]